MSGADVIHSEDVLRCPLCGSESKRELYDGLRDRIWGAPGEWAYKSCRNCGLVFLDPRPTQEDISKAYAVYPTHSSVTLSNNLPRRLRSYLRRGYIAGKFGYTKGVPRLQRLVGRLVYLHPGQREVMNASIMYLSAKHRGRVLDVGAGAGAILNELRNLGWGAEGIDFDAEAVKSAVRTYDLDVKVGTLEDQRYPSGQFDAVVMSHVIEHVHDPVQLLGECWRILKPGGMFVVVTPNAESLGRWYFGVDWTVLEPPRHLTVFSCKTLGRAARQAGIPCADLKTTARGANGIFILSKKLRLSKTATVGHQPFSVSEKLMGHAYQYLVSLTLRFMPGAGEELLMIAVKDR
jgi:2-polyprenyl-3-methyl-5-hydroxy-6-metoxy-1,4-benzoquinol methylase